MPEQEHIHITEQTEHKAVLQHPVLLHSHCVNRLSQKAQEYIKNGGELYIKDVSIDDDKVRLDSFNDAFGELTVTDRDVRVAGWTPMSKLGGGIYGQERTFQCLNDTLHLELTTPFYTGGWCLVLELSSLSIRRVVPHRMANFDGIEALDWETAQSVATIGAIRWLQHLHATSLFILSTIQRTI